MKAKERFLAALKGQVVDRRPVWLMRQAGRYLPEYRKLKETHSFVELAQTPELAAEVTLQPLRRFEFDASIIFSDILVIPEALGQPYSFRAQGGIQMNYTLQGAADIAKLDGSRVAEKLNYVAEALRIVKGEIGHERALLGFGGSPWTLATYMIEGGSSRDFDKIKCFAYSEPKAFEQLMELLSSALVEYFKMQIAQGIDALQIFDSWGAVCPGQDYWNFSLRWIERIIAQLPADFPVILFAKGMSHHADLLLKTGAKVLSLDPTVKMAEFRTKNPGNYVIQGNLDPAILSTTPEIVRAQAGRILTSMEGDDRFIFNLGHGILPSAKIENVEALLETIQAHAPCPA